MSSDQSIKPDADGHILQSREWAQLKSYFGWQSVCFSSPNCSAQVLFKSLPLGLSIAYLPKGPNGTDWLGLWGQIEAACRQRNAIFLQVEPDLEEPYDVEALRAQLPSFVVEEHTFQPRRSILIDLRPSEEEILATMKQKTRYNIRLAQKKGVIVQPSHNLEGFYRIMQNTGARDGFAIHQPEYYRLAFEGFEPGGHCVLLEASLAEEPLAYLMLFLYGRRAWYLYGASDDQSRNLMPTYLLQWEAIRYARDHGAIEYDLWGIPDAEPAKLEANFETRNDGLWGVYRFKRGFGGRIVRTAPAFLKIFRPMLYRAYSYLRARRGGEDHA